MLKRILKTARPLASILAITMGAALIGGCPAPAETGTLQFHANGEGFIRQGFVSRDGWALTFDHVYITLGNIVAYQASPPYDAEKGGPVQAEVRINLRGTHTVDLAEGGEDAPAILVGEAKDVPTGHYNAISWKVIKAAEGPARGYSLVIIGRAEKEGQTISFTIRFEEERQYTGGEFIGEERKGILHEGGTADLEMTFHFDHLFGDGELPPEDEMNIGAAGFEMFAALAEDGVVDIVVADLGTEDYRKLKGIFDHLAHVGEGHVYAESL
ncbi:MAG: hypothetical protein DDT24_00589 [Chloroflexi bacterium]|nr:hypothetical protein [Chloroflexota bacterium]